MDEVLVGRGCGVREGVFSGEKETREKQTLSTGDVFVFMCEFMCECDVFVCVSECVCVCVCV